MSKLKIILGGITLPDQTELTETPTPNAVDVRTLGGDLYTDFINYYRSWTVTFATLDIATWNSILTLYKSQFRGETYLTLEIDALSINTVVKLDIPAASYRWNGTQVGDGSQSTPTLTLQEAVAIS